MSIVLIGVAAYVILQFAIGIWVSRRISTEGDYINAGRQIGPVIGAFTVFATWFGAEAVVGAAGEVYKNGLSGATIDPFGYAAALAISGLVLAVPLWRRGYVTFGDLFKERFSPGVEKLAICMMLPGTLMWAAAQIRAFGQVMGTAGDLEVSTAIMIGAVIVIAYSVLGGLLADAFTDFIQGLAIIAGLVVLGVLVAQNLGGVSAAFASVPAERLEYGAAFSNNPLMLFEEWAIPISGTLVSIELISRMLGARSAETARLACVAGGGLYLTVGLIPVFLGLVGPELLPGLEDGERIVPQLAEIYLPTWLYVLFAGALVSAILSTVDSALIASGGILSHNVVQPMTGELSDERKLLITRVSVAAFGAVAFVIAMQSGSIHELIETAASFGSAGLVVVTLFGLFTPIGGPVSAIVTLLTGALVWAVTDQAGLSETPYLVAVSSSVAVYLLFSRWERKNI